MTIGGRPKEGSGHKSLNLSIENDIFRALEKVGKAKRSSFIEKTIQPVLNQMDPGPSCKILRKIDELLTCEIAKAMREGDSEKATAIAQLAHSLNDHRKLCHK